MLTSKVEEAATAGETEGTSLRGLTALDRVPVGHWVRLGRLDGKIRQHRHDKTVPGARSTGDEIVSDRCHGCRTSGPQPTARDLAQQDRVAFAPGLALAMAC